MCTYLSIVHMIFARVEISTTVTSRVKVFTLKMEAVRSSETLVSYRNTRQCHEPE